MKHRQLAFNIAANFVSVMVSLLVSLLLTPYIVANIGKEAYSFVPISNNFVQYMTILTVAMTSMTARFVTLSMHKGEVEKAKSYFSTAFFTNLSIALVSLTAGFFIVLFLDRLIDIPQEILGDVRLLFIFMFLMFFVNVSTNIFSVPAFSVNRIDVTGMVTLVSILVRLLVIILAFVFFPPHVYYIGLSILAYMLIQGILNYFFSRRLMPALKIEFRRFDLKLAKELGSSGIWSSFNQLSTVLLTGLDLVIANVVLGASAAGVLAVAKTAPMALQMLVNVVPQSFAPHLTILYAKESRDAFVAELRYTLKISALLTGIPIAGFIVLAPVFFRLWVPSVASSELVVLSILTLGSMVASFGLLPLLYVFTITNRLKIASMSVFLSGTLNLLLVLLLLRFSNLGLYAVAGVSSVLESLRFLVFVPMYASHCLHIPKKTFYPSIFQNLFYLVVLIVVYFGISSLLNVSTWSGLGLSALLMGVAGLLAGSVVLMKSADRARLMKRIPWIRRR
ncbi:MAG: MATE family efflux transporter [Erysipelotrichaceae bacterium]|nr:MATE family efflux transporter [Erysipelotrichaceae bacterium]